MLRTWAILGLGAARSTIQNQGIHWALISQGKSLTRRVGNYRIWLRKKVTCNDSLSNWKEIPKAGFCDLKAICFHELNTRESFCPGILFKSVLLRRKRFISIYSTHFIKRMRIIYHMDWFELGIKHYSIDLRNVKHLLNHWDGYHEIPWSTLPVDWKYHSLEPNSLDRIK